MPSLPAHLATERLSLRPWTETDRPAYEETVADSLDHLRPWLPWARLPQEDLWDELRAFLNKPESAHDVLFAIFDRDETRLLGGIGVHRRGPESEREIGYWLRRDAEGQGLMTEAVRAVNHAVFTSLPIEAVTIICDPANERSAAVARRIGCSLDGIFPTKCATPDRTEDMIWRLTREAWQDVRAGRLRSH